MSETTIKVEEKVAAVTERLRAECLWIYTVSDVAREHRVSSSTVRKWRVEGRYRISQQ